MKFAPRALLLSALLVASAVPASGGPPPAAPASAATIVVPIVAPASPAAPQGDAGASTLAAELAQRSDAAKREVAALQRRHDATAFAPLRDAFQQRIEAVKREESLDLLAIRLRHAQANGRADDAREIAAALEAQRKQPVPALRVLPAEPAPSRVAPIAPVTAKKEGGR